MSVCGSFCRDVGVWLRSRAVRVLGVLAGSVILMGAGGPCVSAELAIAKSGSENVFVQGEVPEFRIASGQSRAVWRVLDLDRTEIRGGNLPASTTTVLRIPMREPGYYRLIVEDSRDSRARPSRLERGFVILPERNVPVGVRFGVVSHFAAGWQPRLLRLAALAGIRGIRDEQPWKVVEKHLGQLEFPKYLDGYVREASNLGLDSLVALTFGNPLYDDGLTPFSQAGVAAFARYGCEVARHFTGVVQALEVWNEFNGDFATGPVLADRPLFYSRLLRETSRCIKAIRPQATVVGGAVAGVPIGYFRQLFEHGAMDALDVIEIHPYRTVPEGVEYEIRELRGLSASFNGGRAKPIWATEAGISQSQDRELVAERLVRLLTVLVSEGVDRVYWYLLRDQGPFTGLGLLEGDESAGTIAPTPAYAAYATLIRMVGGAQHVRREPTDARTYIELFNTERDEIRVAWAPSASAQLSMRARSELEIVSLDGREIARVSAGETAHVALSGRPIYISGRIDGLSEKRDDQLIADSVSDFTATQGAGNWSYGFYEARDTRDGSTALSTEPIFRAAGPAENDWSFLWTDPRLPFLGIAREKMHPSKTGDTAVPAVRRWHSPASGMMRITGTVQRDSDQGDGIELDIAVGGQVVKSELIGGPGRPRDASFALTHLVHKGTNIDFVVRPGPSEQSTIDFDMTSLRVEIARLVQPRDSGDERSTGSGPVPHPPR